MSASLFQTGEIEQLQPSVAIQFQVNGLYRTMKGIHGAEGLVNVFLNKNITDDQ